MKSTDTSRLEDAIGYSFRNKELLIEALTHRSYYFEHPESQSHNERLEFLGDSVLNLVASQILYNNSESLSEAEMTRLRAHAVSTTSLAEAAGRIELGSYIRVGKGEEETGGRKKKSILADALEAVLGAVYLDGGLGETERFINQILGEKLKDKRLALRDPKTALQEQTQMKHGKLPLYKVLAETKKEFLVGVFLNGKLLGEGRGRNKKEAESEAAKEAIRNLKENF